MNKFAEIMIEKDIVENVEDITIENNIKYHCTHIIRVADHIIIITTNGKSMTI